MAKEDVLIKKDWLDDVEDLLNESQMEKLCYGLVMYGIYGDKLESDDKMLQMGLNLIYSQMDKMGANYSKRKGASELGAEKRAKLDPVRVWGLYNNEGLSGAEIIKVLEEEMDCRIPKSTLYSNKGWQERDNKHPSFIKVENVEIPKNSENTNWEF